MRKKKPTLVFQFLKDASEEQKQLKLTCYFKILSLLCPILMHLLRVLALYQSLGCPWNFCSLWTLKFISLKQGNRTL